MRLIDADETKVQIRRMQTLKPSEKNLLALALDRTPTYDPPNDPLTLEELREMDGEPVYLDFEDGGEWALVRVLQGKVFVVHKNTICSPVNILFECGGTAYRRKPEEEQLALHEALSSRQATP